MILHLLMTRFGIGVQIKYGWGVITEAQNDRFMEVRDAREKLVNISMGNMKNM